MMGTIERATARRRHEGSAYLLVLVSLLIAAMGISLLLSRHKTRRFHIRALRDRFQVHSAAEAGVIELYHRLKGTPFEEVGTLPLRAEGRLGGASYVAAMSVDGSTKTVAISSSASLGKTKRSVAAVAIYKSGKVGRQVHFRWGLRYLD